jgi:hypothetical protein
LKSYYRGQTKVLQQLFNRLDREKNKPEFKLLKLLVEETLPTPGIYSPEALYAMHIKLIEAVTSSNKEMKEPTLIFLAKASRLVGLEAALDLFDTLSETQIQQAAAIPLTTLSEKSVSQQEDYEKLKRRFKNPFLLFSFFAAIESLPDPSVKNDFLNRALCGIKVPEVLVGPGFFTAAPHLPAEPQKAWEMLKKISSKEDVHTFVTLLSQYDGDFKKAEKVYDRLQKFPDSLRNQVINYLKDVTVPSSITDIHANDQALLRLIDTGEKNNMGEAVLKGFLQTTQ